MRDSKPEWVENLKVQGWVPSIQGSADGVPKLLAVNVFTIEDVGGVGTRALKPRSQTLLQAV